jgi:hypothetical protein
MPRALDATPGSAISRLFADGTALMHLRGWVAVGAAVQEPGHESSATVYGRVTGVTRPIGAGVERQARQPGTELPHGRHHRNVGRRNSRTVWRKVVVSVLVVVALAVVWVWPAFSEPPHRAADCRERHWGYDALGRRWACGDHWLIRIGDYGVLWV